MTQDKSGRACEIVVGLSLLAFLLTAFLTLMNIAISFGLLEPISDSNSSLSIIGQIVFYLVFGILGLLAFMQSVKILESSNKFIIFIGLVSLGFWASAFANGWLNERKIAAIHQFLDADFKTEFVKKCLAEATKEEITFAHNKDFAGLKTNTTLKFGDDRIQANWMQVNELLWKWKYTDPYVHLAIYGNNNEGLYCILSLVPNVSANSVRTFDDFRAEEEDRNAAAEERREIN